MFLSAWAYCGAVEAAIRHLPLRQREIVIFFLAYKSKKELTGEFIIDLQPMIDYGGKTLSRRCPCITSCAKLFALSAMRELVGCIGTKPGHGLKQGLVLNL